ncbi:NAD(P)(+) transhydrogenase (Re/Si-specific) subunit beta [Marinivivus vitaminiproducens]|uniref:NAD(P)(+) transhydrogenase (Re/Si-specific) subunit beta n=1 Tax=Marinivivus vitaminiproducens TaxID=3035935 RepID=UPI00279AF816|nr:NAD(P)(+) transhydrogenase (Re/Si-specific) subunit beta [Geminicoccaceae bacterium SCSIO 64248]
MSANVIAIGYLVAAVCFIMALRGLSHPSTARQGNLTGMVGMAIAIVFTLFHLPSPSVLNVIAILIAVAAGGSIGYLVAKRIEMTAMPQLVAAFHSLVGLAAVLVAIGAFSSPEAFGIVRPDGAIKGVSLLEMGLGTIIGALTFSGSVIAFGKLQAKFPPHIEKALPAPILAITSKAMNSAPILLPARHVINVAIGAAILVLLIVFIGTESVLAFTLMTLLAFAIGFLLIIPIGGADMPVVVSMLNSYSGWAAAGIGFTLQNPALIITGALVGSAGAILSYIMCRAMNRSFISVILGGFGATAAAGGADAGDRSVRPGSAEDAAFIMKNASKVLIVPGYGMAVAQAQHAVRELMDALTHAGVEVKFAIHPVAGRMPGHMNVLLAEANVPYDVVHEMEEINSDFQTTDVAYVIGANDITNPAAKEDSASPIFGMPILDVERAKTVLFVKRSMAPGYAGIDNTLFFKDNTMMLFGDAKKMTEEIVRAMEAA